MPDDIIQTHSKLRNRLASIENGTTLTRPHPKWLPTGGGSSGVNYHPAIFDIGHLNYVVGYYSDVYPLSVEGSAIANVRYVYMTAACTPWAGDGTGDTPREQGSAMYIGESPVDPDSWRFEFELTGPDSWMFANAINLVFNNDCILALENNPHPAAIMALNAANVGDPSAPEAQYLVEAPKSYFPDSIDMTSVTCTVTIGSIQVAS